MDSKSIDIDYFTSDHFYIYKLAYKNPWQIGLLIPDFEKAFDKSYNSSDDDSYDDSDSYEDDMCCYDE